jgi:hypothetical protein
LNKSAIFAAALAAPLLSGCLAYQAASAITGAAVGTITALGRAVTRVATSTSNSVSRTVNQIPARMMYGPYSNRRIVVPVRGPQRTTRTAGVSRPQPVKTSTAKAKPKSKERLQLLEVLPPGVLDKMSKDELVLQAMIQNEALDSETDEVIYWDLEGHSGTAWAEPAHRMGAFTCRLITESAKLDADEDAEATQSKATVCKTDDTGWTLSF